jgi:hypothetical protein
VPKHRKRPKEIWVTGRKEGKRERKRWKERWEENQTKRKRQEIYKKNILKEHKHLSCNRI